MEGEERFMGFLSRCVEVRGEEMSTDDRREGSSAVENGAVAGNGKEKPRTQRLRAEDGEARDVLVDASISRVDEKMNGGEEGQEEEGEVDGILRKMGYPKTVTALVGRYKIKTRERLLVEMRLEERRFGERLGVMDSEEKEGGEVGPLVRQETRLRVVERDFGGSAVRERRSSV